MEFIGQNGERLQEEAAVADHGKATRQVPGWLDSTGLLRPDRLGAVGHRVVHGVDRFVEPVLIDDEVMKAIEDLSELAPLHNRPSLSAIRTARGVLCPGVPQVATF
jgi:acetate kinase